MHFSERIKSLREQRGWSQEQLARKANKPRSNIASLETRGTKRMSVEMLTALASAFEMSVSEFIEEDTGDAPQTADQLWRKLKSYQPVSVPVRGFIPCGTPEIKEEQTEGYISVPRELLRAKKDVYVRLIPSGTLLLSVTCATGEMFLLCSTYLATLPWR